MNPPWNLLAWIACGFLAGAIGGLVDTPRSGRTIGRCLAAGAAAGLAGGGLATLLGFGGFAALDWRSLAVAATLAVAAVFGGLAWARRRRSR